MSKAADYAGVLDRLRALLDGERDEVAAMATIVCELHHGLAHFDWTGFYRVVSPGLLKVGPYQGRHGCLAIPFSRGICGKCAREAQTQIVADVTRHPDHLACAGSTRSEIVVPVFDPSGRVCAVLDVDSDTPAAFDESDATSLGLVCSLLTRLGTNLGHPPDRKIARTGSPDIGHPPEPANPPKPKPWTPTGS
jgi:GAF domain-containing protein